MQELQFTIIYSAGSTMAAASRVILQIARAAAAGWRREDRDTVGPQNGLLEPPSGIALLAYAAVGAASRLTSHAAAAREGDGEGLLRWAEFMKHFTDLDRITTPNPTLTSLCAYSSEVSVLGFCQGFAPLPNQEWKKFTVLSSARRSL
jgi:hypothetical protein